MNGPAKRERCRAVAACTLIAVSFVVPGRLAWAQDPTTTVAPTTTTTQAPTTTLATTTTSAEPTTTTTDASTTSSSSVSSTSSSSTSTPSSSTSTTDAVTPGTEPELSDQEKENLKNSDILTADELQLLDRYLAAQLKLSQTKVELARVNNELLATQQDLFGSIDKVRDTFHQLAETERKLEASQVKLDAHQARLRTAAVETYISGGRGNSAMAALLKSHTIDDLTKGRMYADAVVDDEIGQVERYSELRDYIADLKAQAASQQAAAEAARDARVAREDEVERRRDEQIAAQEAAQEALTQEAAVLAEVALKRPNAFAASQDRSRHSDSVAGILNKAQAGEEPAPIGVQMTGYFKHPLPAARLSQGYGRRIHPLFGYVQGHPGIDLAIGSGTPIVAPENGVVVMAEWYDGYGNCTIIDHGSHVGTLYGHQTSFAVKEGDFVLRGQVIGFVGSTGYSTGPHLHWEVRLNGDTIDPLPTIGER